MAALNSLIRAGMLAAAACVLAAAGLPSTPVSAGLQKLTDHYHYMPPAAGLPAMGAVVTREGALFIDPPPDADHSWLPGDAGRSGGGTVRWVVATGPSAVRAGAGQSLLKSGAALILSEAMESMLYPVKREELFGPPEANERVVEARIRPAGPSPRFAFERQMRLFPAGVEVRIVALRHRARTAADVVVFLPADKVLHAGELFTPRAFPEIDVAQGGSAAGWVDGLRQAVDLVPILKSAMPQPKPDPSKPSPEEKTLEELVLVVPGRGPLSNLQEMKDTLEAALRMRTEAFRAAAAGRSLRSYLAQGNLSEYRQWENFEAFATLLYESASIR